MAFEKLPIGKGQEIIEARKEFSLPVTEIKNVVLQINPAFPDLPFNLKEGENTRLVAFLTPNEGDKTGSVTILPEGERGRSGLIGSIIFRDEQGNVYRDVDVKGIGGFERTYGSDYSNYKVTRIKRRDEKDTTGIVRQGRALTDWTRSEEFIKAGIRTHRIIAIVRLEEIVDEDGKKISVTEAKEKGILQEDIIPVAEIRAFGTRERVENLSTHFNYDGKVGQRAKKIYEDALMIISQELGYTSKMKTEKYLPWFIETLAKQLVKMHRLKLYHGYLSPHNITLDCRIVDLDSVAPFKATPTLERERDMAMADLATAAQTVKVMIYFLQKLEVLSEIADPEDYSRLLAQFYHKEEKEFSKMNRLRKWLQQKQSNQE